MKTKINLRKTKKYESTKSIRIPMKIGTYLHICTLFLICISAYLPIRTFANNLTLGSTITIVDASKISFTVKWDNSWYVSTMPNNWDAIWLFVKYKDCSTTNWQHATISTTLTDHTVSGGSGLLSLEMPAVNDGNGIFIRRTATGSGNITNAETVTLKLNVSTGSYNFKVFGIEMVKVLNENFQVGDGTSTATFNSVTISSENAITAATLGGTGTVDLPAAYPKGWNAFYCMKYEITQEQYKDFLNCLSYDQQTSRTSIPPNSMANNMALGGPRSSSDGGGNGIRISVSGYANTTPAVYSCDANGQNAPVCSFGWNDLAAYLDWACLRPMTDLEFEKICRGPLGRIGAEYPWGNTTLTIPSPYFTNFGATNETAGNTGIGLAGSSNGEGNACNGSMHRVGFAATTTTDRIYSGAAYYGAMDMGGNVWERVVATNAAGSVFSGTLGDGALDASGNANAANWPGTTASGSGFRGNGFYCHTWDVLGNYISNQRTRTSDRNNATTTSTARFYQNGGRGVR